MGDHPRVSTWMPEREAEESGGKKCVQTDEVRDATQGEEDGRKTWLRKAKKEVNWPLSWHGP